MTQTPNVGPRENARATGFNGLAVGSKVYGPGRGSPNLGPTANLEGYRERNLTIEARKAAITRRLKSQAGSGPIGLS